MPVQYDVTVTARKGRLVDVKHYDQGWFAHVSVRNPAAAVATTTVELSPEAAEEVGRALLRRASLGRALRRQYAADNPDWAAEHSDLFG